MTTCPALPTNTTAGPEWLWRCDGVGCRRDCAGHALLSTPRVGGRRLCGRCVLAEGCPGPDPTSISSDAEGEMIVRARERMLRKGGPDRHLARKGRV